MKNVYGLELMMTYKFNEKIVKIELDFYCTGGFNTLFVFIFSLNINVESNYGKYPYCER